MKSGSMKCSSSPSFLNRVCAATGEDMPVIATAGETSAEVEVTAKPDIEAV
jgi:hypothetical protein